MAGSLTDDTTRVLLDRLRGANAEVRDRYPLDTGARQPVHTVYGGAHLWRRDLAGKLGAVALDALDRYGGGPGELCGVLGLGEDRELSRRIEARVRDKLAREPVEDFRIDFEDGYGNRPDDEEDGHAAAAAAEVAAGLADGTLPPFIGIRIKPLSDELAARSLRTLDHFVTALLDATGGVLPPGFVVTLPKITTPDHVEVLAQALGALESACGLDDGALRLELMIETTQSLLGMEGECDLPLLVEAAGGRCTGAHFGTYDYTACHEITAAYQHMRHPACDFAKQMMKVAYAGTGLWLSDGATNIMPVPVHRSGDGDPPLTDAQRADNTRSVRDAWRLHAAHVRHSLEGGFYQGWDLHPAQLPSRYATVYAFFADGLAAASERLSNFVARAARATLVGDVFDDAATGQGLLNFFVRGMNCGALSRDEALATGLTTDELRGRSFVEILARRRAGEP